MFLCVQFEGTIGAEGLTFKFLERRLKNNSPDNVWYCRCLPVLFFTIVVRTDVMGSVSIKCALLNGPLVKAGAVWCPRSRARQLAEEGRDL